MKKILEMIFYKKLYAIAPNALIVFTFIKTPKMKKTTSVFMPMPV